MLQQQTPQYQARLHWVIFFLPTFITVLGAVLTQLNPLFKDPGLLLIFVGIVLFLINFVSYKTSFLNVFKSKLTLKKGLLRKVIIDISYNKIESIDIRQSILGSLLGYGTLVIAGTGGTRRYIAHIAQPLTCRRHIEQIINSVHHET